ncbi:hypothetical protein B0H34DRAFT_670564 [Crassisporium funariophilum]|nr:hypothetical protein B0H34DRAFT_670564 [Crassisporium funariophilum]
MLYYHIRGAMLHEYLRNKDKEEFAHGAHKAVAHETKLNFEPGVQLPYCYCARYQSLASSLAMNKNAPPTTRSAALKQLGKEIIADISTICRGQNFGLTIPDKVEDDWTNEEKGYSWMSDAKFIKDKRCLLKSLMDERELFQSKNGRMQPNMLAICTLMRDLDKLMLNVCLFSIMTTGEIPRVTEWLDHKFANSTRGRNLFRDGKCLWFVIWRLKQENLLNKESFVPQKCHLLLTKILELCLIVIQHFSLCYLASILCRYPPLKYLSNMAMGIEELMMTNLSLAVFRIKHIVQNNMCFIHNNRE